MEKIGSKALKLKKIEILSGKLKIYNFFQFFCDFK